jgi:3D (Asp-Asp-Asp) domain-containing protein
VEWPVLGSIHIDFPVLIMILARASFLPLGKLFSWPCLLIVLSATNLGAETAGAASLSTPNTLSPSVPTDPSQALKMRRSMDADDFKLRGPTQVKGEQELWATYYYVHQAKRLERGISLLNQAQEAISAPMSPQDFCLGAIEGTIRAQTAQGQWRTYNFDGQSTPDQSPDKPVRREALATYSTLDCQTYVAQRAPWVQTLKHSRYRYAFGPFGDGAYDGSKLNFVLVPHRSVAADPALFKPGTVLYIAAAKGLPFKTSGAQWRRHDGYFFVADVGPAIKGNHIDMFLGTDTNNPFESFAKSQDSARFKAQVVDTPSVVQYLQNLHRWTVTSK